MLAPDYILAPVCSKSTYDLTFPMPLYVRQAAGASIMAGAPRHKLPKGTITMGPQAAGPRWAPRELKMVLTLFKNGFHSHPNALKSVGGWGSAPYPHPRGRVPSTLVSLTRRGRRGATSHLRPGRHKPSVRHCYDYKIYSVF